MMLFFGEGGNWFPSGSSKTRRGIFLIYLTVYVIINSIQTFQWTGQKELFCMLLPLSGTLCN